MSATINLHKFSQYFDGAPIVQVTVPSALVWRAWCPPQVLSGTPMQTIWFGPSQVPGRLWPIKVEYHPIDPDEGEAPTSRRNFAETSRKLPWEPHRNSRGTFSADLCAKRFRYGPVGPTPTALPTEEPHGVRARAEACLPPAEQSGWSTLGSLNPNPSSTLEYP